MFVDEAMSTSDPYCPTRLVALLREAGTKKVNANCLKRGVKTINGLQLPIGYFWHNRLQVYMPLKSLLQ